MDKFELIPARQVWQMLGIGKTQFYELVKCDGFPKMYRIGKRSVRWNKWEVKEWAEAD